MLGRPLSNLPSWFFLVLMAVSGIGGWFLLSSVLHGGETSNAVIHWTTLFLAVLAFAVFCVYTRIWHERQRPEAEHRNGLKAEVGKVKILLGSVIIGLALIAILPYLTAWPVVLEGVTLVVFIGILGLAITRRAQHGRRPDK
jgi:formate hydrogenlyase subunit 3/multisubunit Na+/H+ antiporter MnhD subunit